MNKLFINKKHLEIIRKLIKEHVVNDTVLAFGSRVTGRAHDASDLDIVVISKENPTEVNNQIPHLRTALQNSSLPIIVDILDWATTPDSFRAEIMKKHYVIQK